MRERCVLKDGHPNPCLVVRSTVPPNPSLGDCCRVADPIDVRLRCVLVSGHTGPCVVSLCRRSWVSWPESPGRPARVACPKQDEPDWTEEPKRAHVARMEWLSGRGWVNVRKVL